MAIAAALGGLGNSILGRPRKALLIIQKPPVIGLASSGEEIAQMTRTFLSTLGAGGKPVSYTELTAAFTLAAKPNVHIMQVQYNPSSLSIFSTATDLPMQYLQSASDSGIPTQLNQPPSTTLSVELVFDAMNVKDAFMFEKFRLSVGDAVSAASAIKTALNGGYTVQKQTNGLVAALARPETRQMVFAWADMSFVGELISAQARYTMFSVSGKPIRSQVRMELIQYQVSTESTGYWNTAFDKCFGASGTAAASGGKGLAGKAGNLLNLGF